MITSISKWDAISRYDRALFLFFIAYRWQCESWIPRVSHCKTFFTFFCSAGMGWVNLNIKVFAILRKKCFGVQIDWFPTIIPQLLCFWGVSRQKSVVQNIVDRSLIVAKKNLNNRKRILLWVDSWYCLLKKLENPLKTLSIKNWGKLVTFNPTRRN